MDNASADLLWCQSSILELGSFIPVLIPLIPVPASFLGIAEAISVVGT